MRIALYTEKFGEVKVLSGQLEWCARENLRFAKIVPYVRQEDFCSMVRDGPEERTPDGPDKCFMNKNREAVCSQN